MFQNEGLCHVSLILQQRDRWNGCKPQGWQQRSSFDVERSTSTHFMHMLGVKSANPNWQWLIRFRIGLKWISSWTLINFLKDSLTLMTILAWTHARFPSLFVVCINFVHWRNVTRLRLTPYAYTEKTLDYIYKSFASRSRVLMAITP